jgi:hypothetical protein
MIAAFRTRLKLICEWLESGEVHWESIGTHVEEGICCEGAVDLDGHVVDVQGADDLVDEARRSDVSRRCDQPSLVRACNNNKLSSTPASASYLLENSDRLRELCDNIVLASVEYM